MFGNIVLFPIMPKVSSAARADFGKLVAPLIYRYSLRMAILALVSGALLFGYVDFLAPKSEAVSSLGDPFIGVGGLLGLAGLLIFTLLQQSTAKKTKEMTAQMAQSPTRAGELGAKLATLQKRSVIGARVGLVLLLLVIVLMVVGTNVS